jgi:lipoprotein-anchoring transpeptidase ErfK/SrfK
MNPDPAAAQQALLKAQQAVHDGDRLAARHWAELAAALDPGQEAPWLILASVASPRASVAYLEQALKINPGSARAREGMRWAVNRLRQEPPRPSVPASDPGGITRPTKAIRRAPAAVLAASPPDNTPSSWALTKYRRSFGTLLALLVVCVTVTWLLWPGNARPAQAFIQNIVPQSSSTEPGAPVELAKPTYTPSITPTFTPSATYTPTATATATPLPTDTPLPTATSTPWPTAYPTDTSVPPPTAAPRTTPVDPNAPGERWIDVDLSEQRLYAYEGQQVVASFLVSTGVWQYPTVTGQYHIYVKYLYTDMAGVGYYLPNVPYTMYFYRGYGIHGTYWHNNFGHPMSHGCINMYTPDAAWMFNWASVGTLVNIHY